MATSAKGQRTEAKDRGPRLWCSPERYLFPVGIQVFGEGWGPCPVRFHVSRRDAIRPARIVVGEPRGDAIKPVGGSFNVVLAIPGLKPGQHLVRAAAEGRDGRAALSARFTLVRVPEFEKDGRPTHRWFRRQEHFFRRRFGDGPIPNIPSRLLALDHRDRLRDRLARAQRAGAPLDPDAPSVPVIPGANWYCIGPSVVRRGQVFSTTANTFTTAPISGRVTAIAYDPNDTNVVYVGAAQGGVWKSTDGGLNWRPTTDYAPSLAIGSVTVDPSVTDASGRSTRILAGTGEPNAAIGTYYGAGMLFSSDGGATWTTRGTAVFARAAFSTLVVDPNDNQHLYAATDIGVYESDDEGVNWTQLEPGTCHDLVVDWAHVGGPELYVGRLGAGVRRSQDGGATWTTLGGGLSAAPGRVALAMAPGNSAVLYAVSSDGVGGITGIFRTADGGANWNTVTSPAGVGQSFYNLVVKVSPANANTALFGEVHLWRTIDGGTSWTRVTTGSPGIHADQHAIAYHPTNGSLVYIGNDGGVWYSTDGGVTYTHRNKDLATLMYFFVAQHPTWDAVLLGGTQDNGAQRYAGHPAWEHSALGDGAYTAINRTTDTRRWFESRFNSFPIFRSDTAGAAGSWVDKKAGITTNTNWFYPPFAMDPNDSTVLYVGYDELWRTTNSADAWTAITGSLVGAGTNITAITIAPSNSNTLYVGMQNGQIFKVTQSAGTWTATDVTSAPLPAGTVSDIAVHPTDSNTVYVTTSHLLFTEAAGEFTNNHVFRSTDGGTSWQARSTGLAQTNPVNAIVLDPATPAAVFIGCDVGIFRSDDGGGSWYIWDSGLPNCAVHDLEFFAPKRLIRAATHGRSVWERPVDAATYPLVDVYMRDDLVDRGLTLPTPSGVEHPFVPGDTIYWYQSVDIRVDSPDPVTNQYQTSDTSIDYVQFEELTHDNPRRDTFVRVHAQVHNRGNAPATNVQVRAFWANAGGGLPNFPPDFWTAFPNADPADTSVWHPVGPARVIASLYPEQPQIVTWSWLVPTDAPNHTCMLCVVKSAEDNVTTTSLNVATAVTMDNNVTLKNLHVDDVIPGATGADESTTVHFIDFAVLDRKRPFDIRFNPGTLPKGARVHFYFPEFKTVRPIKEALRGLRMASPGKAVRIPPRRDEVCGTPTRYLTSRSFALEVGRVKGRERPGLFGIVPAGSRFSGAFWVAVPRTARPGDVYAFHIEHWIANTHVGGSSYEFRVGRRA